MIEACNLSKGNTNNEKRIGAFFPGTNQFCKFQRIPKMTSGKRGAEMEAQS